MDKDDVGGPFFVSVDFNGNRGELVPAEEREDGLVIRRGEPEGFVGQGYFIHAPTTAEAMELLSKTPIAPVAENRIVDLRQ